MLMQDFLFAYVFSGFFVCLCFHFEVTFQAETADLNCERGKTGSVFWDWWFLSDTHGYFSFGNWECFLADAQNQKENADVSLSTHKNKHAMSWTKSGYFLADNPQMTPIVFRSTIRKGNQKPHQKFYGNILQICSSPQDLSETFFVLFPEMFVTLKSFYRKWATKPAPDAIK